MRGLFIFFQFNANKLDCDARIVFVYFLLTAVTVNREKVSNYVSSINQRKLSNEFNWTIYRTDVLFWLKEMRFVKCIDVERWDKFWLDDESNLSALEKEIWMRCSDVLLSCVWTVNCKWQSFTSLQDDFCHATADGEKI